MSTQTPAPAPFSPTRLPSRAPTDAELDDLHAYLVAQCPLSEDPKGTEAQSVIDAAYIAVIDGFQSDCPGYTGVVMAVVYSGGPDLHEILIYNEGKLVRCESSLAGAS